MDSSFLELNYLCAKKELTNLVNQIPSKYGISFILVAEMLMNIYFQVEKSANNDRRALEESLKAKLMQQEEEKKDE